MRFWWKTVMWLLLPSHLEWASINPMYDLLSIMICLKVWRVLPRDLKSRKRYEKDYVSHFMTSKIYANLKKFSTKKSVAEQEIVKQLVAETASYAESTNCRRKHLLHYFGETYEQDNCQSFRDICLHPKPKMNASEQVQMAIEVIQAVKQQFQDTHIIDILTGNKSTSVVKFKHNKLKMLWRRGRLWWKILG